MIIEVIDGAGVDPERLVEGLGVSLEQLRDPACRVDWEVFARFNDRLEEVCAGVLTPEEVGERLVAVPSFEFLRRAGRLLVSPRQLYFVAQRLVAPVLFPNVIVRHEWLPSGRIVFTGELLPGYRPSEAFFRVCHGNVAALPRVLDLPACAIEEQTVDGTRGRLVVLPPASHTVGARVARSARAVIGLRDAFAGVARQQQALEESLTALRASRQEFRQLLERLPVGVLIQRGGVISWANATMLASLGHERLEDVVGRELLSFLPPEDRAASAARVARAGVRQVAAQGEEYRVIRPDGTVRVLEGAAAQHVEFEGAPARLVVCRDVTEQRRLQDQLVLAERMASLGTLAAGVAHEINNPLAYTQTSLEVAAREIEALGRRAGSAGAPHIGRIAEAVESARGGAARVLGIVRDLKTLSRGEDEPPEAVDVPALIASTLNVAARAIEGRAQVVRGFGPIPAALAPRGRLGQVLLNLFLNAAEAIPEGAPERNRIRVTTSTDPTGRAVVEVADTGVGIAPEVAPRVFDPFFTTKPVGAGTGLGLAICHGIVTELGGEISFESTPGAGTTFRVALPAAEQEPARPRSAAAPSSLAGAPAAGRTRRRVLVVDDEPALLRAVSELLGEAHEVVVASSGRDALELLREGRRFDAVLTDLMMADVTGMDLYEAVRAVEPGLERRMLFMTGGAFTPRGHAFLASVPNTCIEKPFGAEELFAALGECMSR